MRAPLRFGFGCAVALSIGAAASATELRPEHREWLEHLAPAILTDQERAGFAELTDDARRSLFIETFWRVRDPTPGTPANEFKVAHELRVAQADQLYRHGRRPGSTTARGRLHVQLGAPAARERYHYGRIYPLEVWIYYGQSQPGLPAGFQVVFYQPYGAGDFELYDPNFDGPEKLVGGLADVRRFGESSDRVSALRELFKINPNLARAALTSELTGAVDLSGRTSTFGDGGLLVHRLHALADRQRVDTSYVDKIQRGEEVIEVDYAFGLLAVGHRFFPVATGPDQGAVHVLIELPPDQLTLQRYRNRVTGQLLLSGQIDDAGGNQVAQIDRTVEFDLSEQELAAIESRPVRIVHRLALPTGDYRALLSVRNPVNNDVAIVDGTFRIPQLAATPSLGALLLAFERGPSTDDTAAFAFAGRQYEPLIALPSGGTVHAIAQRFGSPSDSPGHWLLTREGTRIDGGTAAVHTAPQQPTHLDAAIPLDDLEAGSYTLTLGVGEVETRAVLRVD